MSDPMTNTEVEDILSSIRRLVSDDKRGDRTPEAPDRLVLTPSLRVGDQAEQDPETPEQEMADKDETEKEAVESAADDAGVETKSDALPLREEQRLDPVGTDDPLAQKIAALEALVARRQDGWEPDGTDASPNAGTDAETLAWQDETPAKAETSGFYNLSPDEMIPDAEFEMASNGDDDAQAADDTETAAEAKEAGTGTETPTVDAANAEASEQESSKADASDDEPAGAVFHRSPHGSASSSETADKASGAGKHDKADGDTSSGVFFEEEIIDEEALRELISDIVRQELQGALGERITRNVRKLVRREIHRALAAQDLE